MADDVPITKADLQSFLDNLSANIGFTGLDRQALGALRAEVTFNTEATERRLTLLETEDKTIHGRINAERDKRTEANGVLHARVTNTRYIFIGVAAVSGFFGGLLKDATTWLKNPGG